MHVLGSYWFLRRADLVPELRALPRPVDFLADSGAFSAYSTGKPITVEEYAEWLLAQAPVINAAATMDVIGDSRATARNTDRLLELVGDRVTVIAVFHAGSPWAEFERLCEQHRYIALGGAVYAGHRETAMLQWCARAHLVAREHDVRLHGFGLTKPPYPELLPWYSVDSAYWISANRTGTLSLWDGRRFVSFRVGRPSAARHARLIRAYGGNPARVASSGFGVVHKSGQPGRNEYHWLRAASLTSWRRYERYIRSRRDLVPPPLGDRPVVGTGLKIYQAVGSVRDIHQVVDVLSGEDSNLALISANTTSNGMPSGL